MASQWTRVTFGEVVRLEQGLCFNKKTNYLMAETGIPLLRIADLINNTQTKFVNEEKVPKKFIANPEDIIYSRTGQVGLVFRGKIGVVHNNCFRIIPKEGIERSYVYWYLRQPAVINQARSLAGGVAQPDLNHDAFKSISFSYPEPKIQRKIASILSAYDDLIENNTRRIKILEEMAQTIYNEWFVKFRFPGHENVKMVDSELGMINQRCIRDNKINLETARRHNGKVTSEKYVQFGDVLINSTGVGTLGRVAQLCEKIDDCTVDTHVSIVRPSSEVELYYFGIALQQLESYFESQGEGATGQTELRRDRIGQTLLLMPPINLQKLFSIFVSPKRQIINILLQKNKRLCETRDLLLPKLISGEIDVSELDINVGGITA